MVRMMSRIRQDAGAVAVLTAVLSVMLFGIAALVVDLGIARDNRRQAQNTADAAALAAANALYATTPLSLNAPGDFTAAVRAAKDYAAKNYGTTEEEWAGCVNPEPLKFQAPGTRTSCISFDEPVYPKQVLVVVPLRMQPSMFGGVFGYTGVSIGALAQARLAPGGTRVCTFCVLGDDTSNIQNGDLNVTGGNAYFNGNITLNPNGLVNSIKGNVVSDDGTVVEDGGNTYVSGSVNRPTNVQPGGGLQVDQPRVVDPLAAQVLPFVTQSTLGPRSGSPCDPLTGGPGIYGGASLRGGTCVLTPGLYVFTGTLDLAGGATLIADGATLYFTCGSGTSAAPCREGDEGGQIKMRGGAQYGFTAPLRSTYPTSTYPTVTEELYGYSLVFDRYNAATTSLGGNSQSFISGTVYGVSTTLEIFGTADGSTPSTGWFVIDTLNMNGTPTLNVQFDASKNVRPSEGIRGLVR